MKFKNQVHGVLPGPSFVETSVRAVSFNEYRMCFSHGTHDPSETPGAIEIDFSKGSPDKETKDRWHDHLLMLKDIQKNPDKFPPEPDIPAVWWYAIGFSYPGSRGFLVELDGYLVLL